TYPAIPNGDRGIRDLYFNMLYAAGQGSLVYIENQYFFDHGIISEIHEAAERGAKIIAILTSKPDEGTLPGKAESVLEKITQIAAIHLYGDHPVKDAGRRTDEDGSYRSGIKLCPGNRGDRAGTS